MADLVKLYDPEGEEGDYATVEAGSDAEAHFKGQGWTATLKAKPAAPAQTGGSAKVKG